MFTNFIQYIVLFHFSNVQINCFISFFFILVGVAKDYVMCVAHIMNPRIIERRVGLKK